jgi:signal transduction histidine kinase
VELLTQLLDNAVRYRGVEPPVVTVSAESVGGGMRVTVADNGPGVSEADLPRLFTAFARPVPAGVAPNGRGAGLGLALCRRIVERHGGMIWAERGADGGLVVRFELPEG